MILYLGSSSLVKLYAEEPFSDVVREWVGQAEIIATCRISYTEIVSAIDLRFKEKEISKKDYDSFLKGFEKDWINFAALDFDERATGWLITKYALTRLDAVHLSSAKLLKSERPDISLAFSSANTNLNRAAVSEGLRVLTFN